MWIHAPKQRDEECPGGRELEFAANPVEKYGAEQMQREIVEMVGKGSRVPEKSIVRHKRIHRQWRIEVLKRACCVAPKVLGGPIEVAVLKDENTVIPMIQKWIVYRTDEIQRGDEQ